MNSRGESKNEVGFIALYGIAVETGVVMVIYLHEAMMEAAAAIVVIRIIKLGDGWRIYCAPC